MISFRNLLALAFIAAPLFGLTQSASAYTILAPDAVVAGKSIVDWTAEWWTWALQSLLATNPLLDDTGAFANVNNNGPVFFIAGGVTPSVTRSFNIPAGRPVLLPLINNVVVDSIPPDPAGTTLAEREAANDAYISAFVNAVDTNSLFASIDGNPVANLSQYLQVTGHFDLGPSQAGSLLEAIGVPAGTDGFPTESGGYWLMIDGLTPGPHTLHFGGAYDAFTPAPNCCSNGESAAFSNDVTDSIGIGVPEPGSAFLLLPALLALARFRRH
jgi:hypothetical protein